MVGEAVGVAVVRLTRAVRLARIISDSTLVAVRSFVGRGGQWNFGRGWRSGGSCGRCALGQSRSTRSQRWVVSATDNIVMWWGNRNFRFGAAGRGCSAWSFSRAVRLARISRWLVSVVSHNFLSFGGARNFGRRLLQRWELRSLCAGPEPCDSLESPILRLLLSPKLRQSRWTMELRTWLAKRWELRSPCRFDQSRATRSNIALACFRCNHSFLSFGGARNFRFGRCSGGSCGRCPLDQSRATRSNIALACFRCNDSFVSCGGTRQSNGKAAGVAVAVRLIRAVRLARKLLRVVTTVSSVWGNRNFLDESRAARSNLRFYACCSPRDFVRLGGQWNSGRGCCSGGSCGRCALDQSRATRPNIALACFRCNHKFVSCRWGSELPFRSLCA